MESVNQIKKCSSTLILVTIQEIGFSDLNLSPTEFSLYWHLLKFLNSPKGCFEENKTLAKALNVSDRTIRTTKKTLSKKIPIKIIKQWQINPKTNKQERLSDRIIILPFEDSSLEIAQQNFLENNPNEKKIEEIFETLQNNLEKLKSTYQIVQNKLYPPQVKSTGEVRQNFPNPPVKFAEGVRQNLPSNELSSNNINSNNVCNARESALEPKHTHIENREIENKKRDIKSSTILAMIEPYIVDGDLRPQKIWIPFETVLDRLDVSIEQMEKVTQSLQTGREFIQLKNCVDFNWLQAKLNALSGNAQNLSFIKRNSTNPCILPSEPNKEFQAQYNQFIDGGHKFKKGDYLASFYEERGVKVTYS